MGGKAKNMHASKRAELTGRGGVDKTAVGGMKDRDTNPVRAKVIGATDKPALQSFVESNVRTRATVYTGEAAAYQGLPALLATPNYNPQK